MGKIWAFPSPFMPRKELAHSHSPWRRRYFEVTRDRREGQSSESETGTEILARTEGKRVYLKYIPVSACPSSTRTSFIFVGSFSAEFFTSLEVSHGQFRARALIRSACSSRTSASCVADGHGHRDSGHRGCSVLVAS